MRVVMLMVLLFMYSDGYPEEHNCKYDVLRDRAAMEQMCYLLEESIASYKELLFIYPDDSFSKHQMGVSYILLGNGELGVKYMQEAIEDLKEKKDVDSAIKLEESTKNWKANLAHITDNGVKFARDRMQATQECRKFIQEEKQGKRKRSYKGSEPFK